MEVKSFRRIGFLYATVCFLLSTVGAIYFFRILVENEPICADIFCGHGISNAVNMVLCAISISLSLFVKAGIDEGIPGYIQVSRVFMVTRSVILILRSTYETVMLMVCQINGDDNFYTVRDEIKATVLLIIMSVICGLELWILDGVQRYVVQKSREDRHDEEGY
ncbi:uncharacterized protein LOC134214992 [Armigeres subalbatus]|uniref:uncharacterized protein LOC134214992 n=1 Tax=Armigeres subalbatus TaxID=124917 RepID=UPI002ED42A95